MAAEKQTARNGSANGCRGKPGPGRPKGIPNRITRDVRAMFAAFAERKAPDFERWVDRTAIKDPARAADLYLKAVEYHIPRLQRTEVLVKPSNAENEKLPTVSNEAVLALYAETRRLPRLPAPQPAPATISRPATQSVPAQPIAAPAAPVQASEPPKELPNTPPAPAPRAPRKQRDDEPVIDVKDDGSGVWTAPPPHPEVGRVMAAICASGDPLQQQAARKRAEATVRTRIKQEADLERSMGRPGRADELLAELKVMGLE
jgi:hypothetical protein